MTDRACTNCELGQYTTAQNLPACSTCYIPPEGNVSVTEDCIQRTQIVVTGKLNVTGVPDANGVLPKIIGGGSNRLFKVGSGGGAGGAYLNLTGVWNHRVTSYDCQYQDLDDWRKLYLVCLGIFWAARLSFQIMHLYKTMGAICFWFHHWCHITTVEVHLNSTLKTSNVTFCENGNENTQQGGAINLRQ